MAASHHHGCHEVVFFEIKMRIAGLNLRKGEIPYLRMGHAHFWILNAK